MAKKKGTHANVIARRKRVWALTCRGLQETEIAEREGVDKSQICRDLDAIHAELDAAPDAAARKLRAANVARSRYGLVIAEALEEWQRSKKDRQRTRTKARSKGRAKLDADGKPVPESTEAEPTTEGRLGDPAYLAAVVKAQSRLDAIEGIDAAKQHDVKGSGSVALRNMTEEQLDEHIAKLEAELRRGPGGS